MRNQASDIKKPHPQAAEPLMVLLFTLFVGLILFNSFTNLGPVYLSDEVHYAAKAAHLAGQGNLLSSSWHAGYSLTLVPIFRLFGVQDNTWIAVAFLNLILLLGALAFWFSTLPLIGLSKRKSLLLSLSSLVCFSVWGFTAWIFVNPWMQLIIAMMSRWLLIKNKRQQLFAITTSGAFAYWVHPTGALIAASAWLTVIIHLGISRRKTRLPLLIAILGGLFCTGLLITFYQTIHSQINLAMGGDGGHYGKQISNYIFEFKQDMLPTIAEVGTAIINGLANISIATYGYGFLFFAGITQLSGSQKNTDSQNRTKVTCFIASSSLLLLLFSSLLAINKGGDYQFTLHQRYFAPMLQALWILGFYQWSEHENQRNLPRRLTLSISPVLGALVIGTVFWDYNKRFSIIDVMSSGSSLFSNALGSEQEALAGLAIGSLLIVLVQMMAGRPKLVLAGIISSIAGWTMNQTRANILSEGSGRPLMIDEIKQLSQNSRVCLVAIPTGLMSGQSNNLYELFLSSPNIQRLRHKREQHQHYNHFFHPDVQPCDHIVAPLDLHLSSNRNDLKPITTRLDQCALVRVDDRYGWGIYQCSQPIGQRRQFNIASSGAEIRTLPKGVKPLRVFTDQALDYDKYRVEYGAVINKEGVNKIKLCRSMNQDYAMIRCNQNQEVKVAKAENVPLFWGLYTNNLQAGDYQLFMGDFKVYKGAITIEIIDKDIHQIKKHTLTPSGINVPIPFNLPTSQKQIEVRIMASQDTQFTLPSYFIITN